MENVNCYYGELEYERVDGTNIIKVWLTTDYGRVIKWEIVVEGGGLEVNFYISNVKNEDQKVVGECVLNIIHKLYPVSEGYFHKQVKFL